MKLYAACAMTCTRAEWGVGCYRIEGVRKPAWSVGVPRGAGALRNVKQLGGSAGSAYGSTLVVLMQPQETEAPL